MHLTETKFVTPLASSVSVGLVKVLLLFLFSALKEIVAARLTADTLPEVQALLALEPLITRALSGSSHAIHE